MTNPETSNPQTPIPQTPNLIPLIAKIIAPHLKTKHKDSVSAELAQQIIDEINKPSE